MMIAVYDDDDYYYDVDYDVDDNASLTFLLHFISML